MLTFNATSTPFDFSMGPLMGFVQLSTSQFPKDIEKNKLLRDKPRAVIGLISMHICKLTFFTLALLTFIHEIE